MGNIKISVLQVLPKLEPTYILGSIIVALIQISNLALAAAYVNFLLKKAEELEPAQYRVDVIEKKN